MIFQRHLVQPGFFALSVAIGSQITAYAEFRISPHSPSTTHEVYITDATSVAATGFEENKGQVLTTTGSSAPFVRYRLSQGDTHLFLLVNGIAYQFNRTHFPSGYLALEAEPHRTPEQTEQLRTLKEKIRTETFRMDMVLEGANADPLISAEGQSVDYTQYYTHNVLGVHTYTKVTYHDVYPNIDWVLYITEQGMKYDFIVRPGADPAQIRLSFKHHEELHLDSDGNLIHGNRLGRFTELAPVSFQNGKEIPTQFHLEESTLHFEHGKYDHAQPLIIDPSRIWGTYYGGSLGDEAHSCTTDGDGNVYLAGSARSTSAIAEGGHQNTHGGETLDAFLVKFDPDGVRLWATYYGGEDLDSGSHCAVDLSGNIFLCGWTESSSNIAVDGFSNTHGGDADAFLVKFDENGVRSWATYYGSFGMDYANSCATDPLGYVYLSGSTGSSQGISFNGHQSTKAGSNDAFLVKFEPTGSRVWGTYYGGVSGDFASSCGVASNGSIVVVGGTISDDGISFLGHQNTRGGERDAFIVRFDQSGVRLWGTYYGGDLDERGDFTVALDLDDNIYLSGRTNSELNISASGFQTTYGGGDNDAFLAKFNLDGIRQWATYYGGDGFDAAYACATDLSGNVYVVGNTTSYTAGAVAQDGIIVSNGYQNICESEFGGCVFMVKFTSDGDRSWGTFYGGPGNQTGSACVTDNEGYIYLAGSTSSTSSIAASGHQIAYAGGGDAFLAKFNGDLDIGISTNEGASDVMRIWPNPAHDMLHLSQPMSGVVVDVMGQTVQTITQASAISLDALATGVYLIRDHQGATIRFVKE